MLGLYLVSCSVAICLGQQAWEGAKGNVRSLARTSPFSGGCRQYQQKGNGHQWTSASSVRQPQAVPWVAEEELVSYSYHKERNSENGNTGLSKTIKKKHIFPTQWDGLWYTFKERMERIQKLLLYSKNANITDIPTHWTSSFGSPHLRERILYIMVGARMPGWKSSSSNDSPAALLI